MGRKRRRLGGGLSLRTSEDATNPDNLLIAQNVSFDEPGALIVQKPAATLTTSLLTATSTAGRTATVMGIVEALFDGARRLFLKNQSLWQYCATDGTGVTSLFDASSAKLVSGDTVASPTGTDSSYTIPDDGTLVVKMWGGGGGGCSTTGGSVNSNGGPGGYTTATFTVYRGDVIVVQVGMGGGGGRNLDYPIAGGGYPDGGDALKGGSNGLGQDAGPGSGGGSSRLYINGVLMAVAGGGGGSGQVDGGSGGGTSGVAGSEASAGGGGTASAGGSAGGTGSRKGVAGAEFEGGAGLDFATFGGVDASGGGGGGGYFGGGGGGATSTNGNAVSGGGGSGFIHSSGSGSTSAGAAGSAVPAGTGETEYDATVGARASGNPAASTAEGGKSDATSPTTADANSGGHGMVNLNYTPSSGTDDDAEDPPIKDWEHQLTGFAFRDHVYLSDGFYFRRIKNVNGTYTVQRVGVQRPNAPTSAVETGSATPGTVTGVTYGFAVSFWNGTAESNLSQTLFYTAVADNKQITIQIPIDEQASSGTISRRIYRTNANGNIMFFVAEVEDNTTTEYTDSISLAYVGKDEATISDLLELIDNKDVATEAGSPDLIPLSLSDLDKKTRKKVEALFDKQRFGTVDVVQTNTGIMANWTDHDQPKSDVTGTVRNLTFLDDVVYGIVDNARLAFTKLGNAEYWSPYNEVVIGRRGGETLMDIKVMGKHIACYTDQGVWRFRRAGVDAKDSVLERVSDQAGACSEAAVAVSDKFGHLYMSKSGLGIYRFDGQNVEKVSEPINELFEDSTHADYIAPTLMLSVVCTHYAGVFEWAYRQTGNTNNTKKLVLDLRSGGEPKWSVSTLDHDSIHRATDGRVFGGTTGNTLQRISPGSFSGESAVTMNLRTPLWEVQGKIEELTIDADLDGATAVVGIYRDDYENSPVASYTLTAPQSAGRQKFRVKVPVQGTWRRYGVQLAVANLTTAVHGSKIYSIGDYCFEDNEEL